MAEDKDINITSDLTVDEANSLDYNKWNSSVINNNNRELRACYLNWIKCIHHIPSVDAYLLMQIYTKTLTSCRQLNQCQP